MDEKRTVTQYHRFSYSGPLIISEFFEYIDTWLKTHGFAKEIKEHVQKSLKPGKEIRYSIECWKQIEDNEIENIRLYVLFSKVKDVVITVKKKKSEYNMLTYT